MEKCAERVVRTGVMAAEGFQGSTRQGRCFHGSEEGQTRAQGDRKRAASLLRIGLQMEWPVGDERARLHAGVY